MTKQLTIVIKDFKKQINSALVQETLNEFIDQKLLKKFTAVVIHAVQANPSLLAADRTSLFLACQQAAKDGLMPDGREGALIPYGKQIQWQPMIHGIRKKLAQAGWDIRAEIVYEKDHFIFESGDDPHIEHRPNVFQDRGEIVGAYAIATDLKSGDKYRETMTLGELENVRNQSNNSKGAIWTVWKTEMYRKVVAKRLRKYLPIGDDSLLDLIDQDNEQFTSAGSAKASQKAQDVQAAVRAANEPKPEQEPIEGELDDPPPKKQTKKKVTKKKTAKKVEPEAHPPAASIDDGISNTPDLGPEPPAQGDDELKLDI